MKINQRGQSALEYLMTYGWALVVIVVVVAALVLLVGNPAGAGDTCSGPGAGLNITNQNLTATGWELVLSNITSRALTAVTPTAVSTPVPGTLPTYAVFTLASGATYTLAPTAGAYDLGTKYRTDFTVTYNDGDFVRTVNFSCNGTA